jgi:hypothetical protein
VRPVVYSLAFSPGVWFWTRPNNLSPPDGDLIAVDRCCSCFCTCHQIANTLADGSQLVAAAGARVFVYDTEGNVVHALKGHTVRWRSTLWAVSRLAMLALIQAGSRSVTHWL